jgi:hypothetical protein
MKNNETKIIEPKIIQDRICMPSPMASVKAGMKFFLEQEQERTIKRLANEKINKEKRNPELVEMP